MPDYIIIGAMKSATSTLQAQLAAQPGIFACTPKEPYFFSDDDIYAKGLDWYQSLFDQAHEDDICGEASTHYTKLPTYPKTLARMLEHAPKTKLIYVMRHPIDRLISQYIHQWSERNVSESIDEAIKKHPILIDYSRYSMQLEPFLDSYGTEAVLPVFLPSLKSRSQEELSRVCRFIGYPKEPTWKYDMPKQNVSRDRMRPSSRRDAIVHAPIISTVRTRLVPRSVRNWIKSFWQMRERPNLSPDNEKRLEDIFNKDLAVLGSWLGVMLTCSNFNDVAAKSSLEWK